MIETRMSRHQERTRRRGRGRLVSALLVAAVLVVVLAVAAMTGVLALRGGGDGESPAPAEAVQPGSSTAPAAADPASAADRAARLSAAGIVDLPVQFTVENVNRSLAPCAVDGRTYTVRGHLTAPQAVLDSAERGITLYQHGIAAGEWYWRIGVAGYDHVEEMAERGHASLTIDRLGYGESDTPFGFDTCVGGQADITHQLVQQLRAGSYSVLGGVSDTPIPSFQRVVLVGQSNGGQISQIATYSFGDVDGLVLMDWTDLGLTPQANARFFTSLQTCVRGGSPADAAEDPSGYAYYDAGPEEFASGNFNDTDPAVLRLAIPEQNRHPCGDMASQLGAVLVDLRHLQDITVPVLFLYGDADARVQGGDSHAALFTGARDTRLVNIPEAGHYTGLERGARLVHDSLASWLDERGL